jgi:4-hydroxybutyrate CoA-transferase
MPVTSAVTYGNDLSSHYQSLLMSAEEAVLKVKPGDRVVVPIGSNPLMLADALAARMVGEFTAEEKIEIGHCASAGDYLWLESGFPGIEKIVHEHWGGPSVRENLRDHSHDYLPMPFSLRFKGGRADYRTEGEVRRADVVLLQVGPPDEHGYLSLGGNAWLSEEFANTSRCVLGEVSKHIPRCYGYGAQIHLSKFDALIENDSPRTLTQQMTPTESHRTIAAYVSDLIHDGDTIEIGAGKITTGIVFSDFLNGKKDIGWHSEATLGRVIDLIQDGTINGSRKKVDRGIAVAASFNCRPDQRDFVHMNPAIETRPTTYVHDIRTIASHDYMVAINQALMIDLTGQIAADSVGHEIIGGTGGQLEFALGAAHASHGRSITVIESTRLADGLSRIVGELPVGTAVTIPRLYADIVVTEFGVARLWGKSLRERARELISIAHPSVRDDLKYSAKNNIGL